MLADKVATLRIVRAEAKSRQIYHIVGRRMALSETSFASARVQLCAHEAFVLLELFQCREVVSWRSWNGVSAGTEQRLRSRFAFLESKANGDSTVLA